MRTPAQVARRRAKVLHLIGQRYATIVTTPQPQTSQERRRLTLTSNALKRLLTELSALDAPAHGVAGTAKEQAMRQAAQGVVDGISIGRRAFRDGKPRKDMASESQRIGWDEAAHALGVAGTSNDKEDGNG